MEYLTITSINDSIFCPASIYFHNLYNEIDSSAYYSTYQTNGLASHYTVDNNTYSTSKNILCGIDVYSEKYGLVGKIDQYDISKHRLVERKKMIKQVFDGYVFQLYGQYFGLKERGYEVEEMVLHSMDDNRNFMSINSDKFLLL